MTNSNGRRLKKNLKKCLTSSPLFAIMNLSIEKESDKT